VARPQERKFLGFSFTAGPEVKRVIAPKAVDRFKRKIREITGRAKGVSMKTTMEELAPYMRIPFPIPIRPPVTTATLPCNFVIVLL
jgi:RNA-directed DNA polymerase